MKSIIYKVTTTNGIHARPASLLVKEINKFKCKSVIKKGEKTVNAKEILAVMSLGIKQGDTITITFYGEDEEEALEAVEKFLKNASASDHIN